MRKNEAPWSRIKRKTVVSETIYEKRKLKGWHKVLIGVSLFLSVVVILTALRLPERIGMIQAPAEAEVEVSVNITQRYKGLIRELLDSEQDLNWDGDGLKNGADPNPWDCDTDRNGIPDGHKPVNFIKGEVPISHNGIKAIITSSQAGFTSYRGRYYFHSVVGWVGISGEKGTPYYYTGTGWKKCEYEYIEDICYVNITGTCIIEFSESDKPKLQDVVLPIEPAECTVRPDDRYTLANSPLSLLDKIYAKIDNGETVQVSIMTDAGEQLLIVYGYDHLGGLYVADTENRSENSKIQIIVRPQVYFWGGKITMRSFFEFSWGEFGSANGDILTVF